MHTRTQTSTVPIGIVHFPMFPIPCMHTLCQIIKIIWKCDVNQTTIELSIGYITNYITALCFTKRRKKTSVFCSTELLEFACVRSIKHPPIRCQWSSFVLITVKSCSLCIYKRIKTNALVVKHKSKFAFQFTLFSIAFGDSGLWDIAAMTSSFQMKYLMAFNQLCAENGKPFCIKNHNRLKKLLSREIKSITFSNLQFTILN